MEYGIVKWNIINSMPNLNLSVVENSEAINGIKRWQDFLKKNYPDSSIKVNPSKIVKKKKISAAIKKLVWNTNIGAEIGKSTDITQMSFNCGHIVAESKGGVRIVIQVWGQSI